MRCWEGENRAGLIDFKEQGPFRVLTPTPAAQGSAFPLTVDVGFAILSRCDPGELLHHLPEKVVYTPRVSVGGQGRGQQRGEGHKNPTYKST